MRQNATPADGALTPAQEAALAALLAGQTVTDAAVAAGVDRTTVHRWLKEDFAFQAAFNGGRQELRQALQGRLLALAEKAVGAVEATVSAGDGKAALALLKGLGLLPGQPAKLGSDDPRELANEARQRELLRGLF
jgi:hypothetical protein